MARLSRVSHAATHSVAKPVSPDNSVARHAATRAYRWCSPRTSGKVVMRLSSNAAVHKLSWLRPRRRLREFLHHNAPRSNPSLWLWPGGAFGVLRRGGFFVSPPLMEAVLSFRAVAA